MQSEYIAMRYKDGVFTFQSMDTDTLTCLINGFIKWAKENGLEDNGKIDITSIDPE
jgi:hypothetical protein